MPNQRPRTRLAVNLGNLLELAGVGIGVYAVSQLAGVAWALIVAAVTLVAGAELVYDGHVARLPLPHRPHPVARYRHVRSLAARRLAVARARRRARRT